MPGAPIELATVCLFCCGAACRPAGLGTLDWKTNEYYLTLRTDTTFVQLLRTVHRHLHHTLMAVEFEKVCFVNL